MEAIKPHLGNPVLHKLKGTAGALCGVLGLLQRHGALLQVPHHVLHLALHCLGLAPGATEKEREEREGVNNKRIVGWLNSLTRLEYPSQQRQQKGS